MCLSFSPCQEIERLGRWRGACHGVGGANLSEQRCRVGVGKEWGVV